MWWIVVEVGDDEGKCDNMWKWLYKVLVHTPSLLWRGCITAHRTAIMSVCTKQVGEAALMDSVSAHTVDRHLIRPRPPRATLAAIPYWPVRCNVLPWDPPVWKYRWSFGWAHSSRSQFSTHEGLGGSLKEKQKITMKHMCLERVVYGTNILKRGVVLRHNYWFCGMMYSLWDHTQVFSVV